MIENMPADGCLTVDCILLMYFCGVEVGLRGGGGLGGGIKQVPLAPESCHIRFKLSYEVYKCI